MRKLVAAVSAFALLLASACTDRTGGRGPTAPLTSQSQQSYSVRPGTCFTAATLTTLIRQLLGAGHPRLPGALLKLTAMVVLVQQNKIPQAQAQARDLIAFLNAQLTPSTPATLKAQIQSTINAILCYVGLPPDTYIVLPSAQDQTVVATDGNSGLGIPGGTLTVPTTFTITTQDPNGSSGLDTKLDQYPSYIAITSSSPLTQPVVVGICLGVSVPQEVFDRLRLGHQKTTGFEITPPANPSFLNCPSFTSSVGSKVPQWLRSLAGLVLPKVAYAKMRRYMYVSGGIGGSAIEFSPFGAVDYGLFASGGLGGSAIEFQQKKPSATTSAGTTTPSTGLSKSLKALSPGRLSASLNTDGTCSSPDATVGTPVDPACRPLITIKTAKGTIMQNVPVSWGYVAGGGTIAPEAIADPITGSTCGTFGDTATTATDVNGKAGVCWTLGSTGGTNTVSAIPNFGGDAPEGVTFLDQSGNPLKGLLFTASAIRINPTAGATGASVPYDGLAHAGSGTCSNGLTPAYSYTTSDNSPLPQAPVDAGSYTLTVTCGADQPNVYYTKTATATITIGTFTPAVTVNCSPSLVFNGADQPAACSASATGVNGADLGPVPVTYGPTTPPHNAGPYTATGNFTASGNYGPASHQVGFSIAQATSAVGVTCTPTSVAYSGGALTPCSAVATGAGSLSVPLSVSYGNNINSGTNTATASATYGGDGNHTGNTGSTTFSITQLAVTATAGSGTMTQGGIVPALPCVIGVLPVDAATVTCTTSVPGTLVLGGNVTTPVVTPSSPANYAVTPVNGLLTVTMPPYVQSGCFASPLSSTKPSSSSSSNPRDGTSVTVKCRLVDATGRPIVTAHGNLVIQDMGTSGASAVSTVFSGTNVFTVSDDHNFDSDDGFYSYVISTTAAGYLKGHYYFVTATWDDGSTTSGWLYLR